MVAQALPKTYILFDGEGNKVPAVRGYQVLGSDGTISQAQCYALNSHDGAISKVQAYVALVNPASVIAENTYALHYVRSQVLEAKGYAILSSLYPPYEDLTVEFPFAEVQFPTSVSYGSTGGPGFKTTIFTVDSGVANATAEWERLRARFSVEFETTPEAEIEIVEAFFYSMRGRAIGFRYKDWNDYNIVNQNIVLGDGVSRQFQIFKRYRSGPTYFDRMIRKPVRDTASSIYLDGVEQVLDRDFFINYTTGVITFVEPPPPGAVGRIDYIEFDVPVRFDTDELKVSAEDFNQYAISSLEMIEILV